MATSFFMVLFANSLFVLSKSACDVKKFGDAGIVPKLVPEVPQILKVLYDKKEVTCGEDLTKGETKSPPVLEYKADSTNFYTLIMIDPDAPDPQRPVYAHFLHWLVVNIPGSRLDQGKVLKDYFPPSPPAYSASHRYVFLVYRQDAYINSPTYTLTSGRSRFDLADAQKVLKLREMVAGNFFYTHG